MERQELIIDSFAGGGGASLGISLALGRSPDIAVNHSPEAIAMHAANHPETLHLAEDVWKVNPRSVTKGRPVGLLWASPDCRHFSRAKGGTPVKKNIRSLAWVVCRWAAEVSPRVIVLENVREFEEWGPLVPRWECRECSWKGTEGQTVLARTRRRCPKCESLKIRETLEQMPDPDRKGLTFKRFVGRLKRLGYIVEWRSLNAADFGAPTHRRRLFLIARRDGEPIVWPERTHGDPVKIGDSPLFGEPLKPWRTAAECIDWSIPCPSIFERKKPLADATLRRIAMGIKRYVLDAARPFIVGVGGRAGQTPPTPADAPVGTVTGKNDRAVVTPYLMPVTHTGERKGSSIDEPIPTVTSAHRGEQAVISPVLLNIAHGADGRWGDGTCNFDAPLGTVHAQGKSFAVVTPILVGAGGAEGAAKPKAVNVPKNSVLPRDRTALVSAFIARHFGGERPVNGADPRNPLPTVTACDHHSVVSAFLTKFRNGDQQNQSADVPMPTVTANSYIKRPGGAAPIGLAAANLIHLNHGDKQWSAPDDPMRTVTSGNHAALVYSFLVKYFGTAIGQAVEEPLGTATGKDRFGVVIVHVDGEPYVIVDIGMRMLSPRELARAQGFPDEYKLTGTKTSQVHKIGNSVSPPVAKAIVEANMAGVFA